MPNKYILRKVLSYAVQEQTTFDISCKLGFCNKSSTIVLEQQNAEVQANCSQNNNKKQTPTAGSAMDCDVLHAPLFFKMVKALIIQLTKYLEKQN